MKVHHWRGGLFGAAAALALTLGGNAYAEDMPTVRLMVGGIDKQIYLPYKLA